VVHLLSNCNSCLQELEKKRLQSKEEAEEKQGALIESPTMEEKAWLLKETMRMRATASMAIEVVCFCDIGCLISFCSQVCVHRTLQELASQ
jgi:hypothetical protein